ncbi:MAG TPA: nucleotidyltransferase domain-containing protein [Candidatus Acidoferrum sp.]|nr:nucleotidyltransferase domain-containing protein [Candidatus Acidoferrum sp.]
MDGQVPQLTEERLQRAVDACTKSGADLVYLYGSQARGRCWAESDVDLAVLLSSEVARDRHTAIRVELIGELMSVFESNKVDVLILNEAPPLLTYEGVIQGGRLLFERDKLTRVRFQVRAFQDYMDTVPLREVQSRYLKEAIHRRASVLSAGAGEQNHTW